ncbi:hypothetical protein RV14_GL002024 [Enterococcus ratti]|uniref:Mga helix-turn-helix domain-containing protein n=1 Tax=Enterococcus ratti TaxID=150033 RepID=A0A1L8WPS4_9ENTE|nr:hypothetical protein RV14_GL002024 [Enterococcus ratti]
MQLLYFIFLHPFTTTSEIVQTFNLSKTKFQNIKKQLVTGLGYYGFSITDSPFCFTGNFNKLCQFFEVFLSEKFYSFNEYMLPKEQELIEQILQGFADIPNFSVLQQQQKLKKCVWVIIKLSAHFPKIKNTKKIVMFNKHSIVIDHSQFKEVFQLPYSDEIQKKLTECYLAFKNPILPSKMKQKKEALITLITHLYELFGQSKKFTIPPMIHTKLARYEGISYLINHEKKRFIFEFFKHNGNFSLHISQSLLNELITFRNAINDDSLFYELLYLLLIHDTYLTNLIINKQQVKKVGLLFTYSKAHNSLLVSLLKNLFQESLTFEVLDFSDCTSPHQLFLSFDYCITNMSAYRSTNSILLDAYPSECEIHDLNQLFQHSPFKSMLEVLKKPLPKI